MPGLLLLLALFSCGKPALLASRVEPAAAARSPAPGEHSRIVARSRHLMGTAVTLTAFTADERAAVSAFDAAFAEIGRIEELMTVWRPESDVSRLNAAAGKGSVHVSSETVEALTQARQLSEWTDGKFDVTFGALSGLWKFDHDQDDKIPNADDIARRLPLIDYREVVVEPKAKTAELRREGMRVHLGGIGKGLSVDRAVAVLRARGLEHFMLQAGGDLYVAGRRGNRAWRVGIRDPRGPAERFFAVTEITDATFSTSGDYERSFVEDGVRYHHILDPTTGQPARLCRSVTVMAKSAVMADGLSTGVFLVGPEKGMALVERLPEVEVVIVDASNQVHVSSGLRGKLKILAPPTDGV